MGLKQEIKKQIKIEEAGIERAIVRYKLNVKTLEQAKKIKPRRKLIEKHLKQNINHIEVYLKTHISILDELKETNKELNQLKTVL